MKKQLLCPTVCCCPEIKWDNDTDSFVIKDDHGGKVFLRRGDIEKVIKDLNELDSMSGTGLDN